MNPFLRLVPGRLPLCRSLRLLFDSATGGGLYEVPPEADLHSLKTGAGTAVAIDAESQGRLSALDAAIRRYGRHEPSLIRECDAEILSVLIPAHRAEKYIDRCLDSVLGQKAPAGVEVEVLVGVDACKRTSEALASRLDGAYPETDKRLRTLFFPVHYGTYTIQNSLIFESRGKHVYIVGADDALAPGALRCLWALGKRCRVDAQAFVIRSTILYCNEDLIQEPDRDPFPCKGAVFFPKTILKEFGGFAPWLCSADRDFLCRARAKGVPIYAPRRPVYLYRRHKEQLMSDSATGGQSAMRAYYGRLIEQRMARGHVYEQPVVGEHVGDVRNMLRG